MPKLQFRPVSNVALLPCRTQLIEFGTAVARLMKPTYFDTAIKFDRVCRATRQWHGSVSNVALLPCRTQFLNYENVYFKCFHSTAPDCDVFFILNLVRRLKPLPCYCRATARSNSFEFDTAVARRLKRVLATFKT